jgi:glutamate/tyrosine decarboxylase-like PLP-dependent enzyme
METPERSLDPPDWSSLRALGHRMLDDMLDHLEHVRDRPVWQPFPDSAKAALERPLPRTGQGEAKAYADFLSLVLPYGLGNLHPRFWGWVMGTGTPFGMLADMLAAGLNANVSAGEHAAPYVEAQVLAWCKEMLGYPLTASGILTTGGSMANLIGLAVAREARRAPDEGQSRRVVYCSDQTHYSIAKAVILLGLGRDALRTIPSDTAFRIDVAALEHAIAEDRSAGRAPICVVGNAGTVNTGAFDDLEALRVLCAREGLWLHVDGAFGALAVLVPELRSLLRGMDCADSLGFDLHKWMYMPYDVGCVLVRDPEAHRRAFTLSATYLASLERGISSGAHAFRDYGPELSRQFRALKVWLCLQAYGVDAFARLIAQNVDQARRLAAAITAHPELELLAPVPLNVVCFRYRGSGASRTEMNAQNREIVMRLQEEGIAAPSSTVLRDDFAIRVAITNHRSRAADFDALVEGVVRLGREGVNPRAARSPGGSCSR